ncbi:MAG: hypothetical protein ACE5KM_10795 [Planctomycetaceae bacterium]
MQLIFVCPRCRSACVNRDVSSSDAVRCDACDWVRDLPEQSVRGERPGECLACGCGDLWRQKDFPVRLGLAFVALGAIGSTVAWSLYEPLWAIGILMGFGLLDLALFAVMRDVMVCYRCGARHRRVRSSEGTPRFDLEIAERYRQEERRLREAGSSQR